MNKNIIYISVITSTYNASNVLQRCIDSVYCQTYKSREHIIIDGDSTDNTLDLIKYNAGKISYWESRPDKCVYEAWNRAIPHINGNWVIFLGADDFFIDEYVLERAAKYLKNAYPEHSLVYGIMLIKEKDGMKIISSCGSPWLDIKDKISIARYELPPHPATFQHISLFNSPKVFDETYKIAGDSKFLAKAIQIKPPIFIPVKISVFSMGGLSGSLGLKQLQMCYEELRVSIETKNIIPIADLMSNIFKLLIKNSLYFLLKENYYTKLLNIYRRIFYNKK